MKEVEEFKKLDLFWKLYPEYKIKTHTIGYVIDTLVRTDEELLHDSVFKKFKEEEYSEELYNKAFKL